MSILFKKTKNTQGNWGTNNNLKLADVLEPGSLGGEINVKSDFPWTLSPFRGDKTLDETPYIKLTEYYLTDTYINQLLKSYNMTTVDPNAGTASVAKSALKNFLDIGVITGAGDTERLYDGLYDHITKNKTQFSYIFPYFEGGVSISNNWTQKSTYQDLIRLQKTFAPYDISGAGNFTGKVLKEFEALLKDVSAKTANTVKEYIVQNFNIPEKAIESAAPVAKTALKASLMFSPLGQGAVGAWNIASGLNKLVSPQPDPTQPQSQDTTFTGPFIQLAANLARATQTGNNADAVATTVLQGLMDLGQGQPTGAAAAGAASIIAKIGLQAVPVVGPIASAAMEMWPEYTSMMVEINRTIELLSIAANSSVASIDSDPVIDKPHIWTSSTPRTFNISFPLYNTNPNGDSDWQKTITKNWELCYLLTYQNLYNKRNLYTGLPPVFYEIEVPGVYYTKAGYVNSINILNVGNIRRMQLPVGDSTTDALETESEGGKTYTTSESIYVNVPDAYYVNISLTDFFMPSRNFLDTINSQSKRNTINITYEERNTTTYVSKSEDYKEATNGTTTNGTATMDETETPQ